MWDSFKRSLLCYAHTVMVPLTFAALLSGDKVSYWLTTIMQALCLWLLTQPRK